MDCHYCHKEENLYKRGFNKKTNKEEYICRECNTKKCSKYRKTDRGKIAVRMSVKKYELSHPKRKIAWMKCRKLEKRPCVICGSENADKHHPDIDKPLEVIYLCKYHHKQEHMVYNNLYERTLSVMWRGNTSNIGIYPSYNS